MKYPGTVKVLQFPPNLLIQGSRCKTLLQGPTIGAPSKYRGGPSLGRTKFKIIENHRKIKNRESVRKKRPPRLQAASEKENSSENSPSEANSAAFL